MSEAVPAVLRLGHDLVRNFEVLPHERATVEIATHIRKFWEPRMRRELLAYVDTGDTRVDALLAEAARSLREEDLHTVR